MIVRFDYDEVRGLGVIESKSLDMIRENFSEIDSDAMIKRKRSGYRHIPTRKYCMTKSGKFELGMTNEIIKYIKSLNFPYKLTYTDAFKTAFLCGYEFHDQPLAELVKPDNYQERYYQGESVKKALRVGNGVFHLKTAAGKTYIAAQLIATIQNNSKGTKTLIIVPNLQLVTQTYSDFISFGFNKDTLCKWSGACKLDPSADVIIATSSILLSKAQDISILTDINLLIIDEVHILKKGNSINQVLKHMPIRNRYGFTGTLPESKIDVWNIIGKIGPILYEVSREAMVEGNFISDADIKIINLNYHNKPKYEKVDINKPLVNYDIETKFTESNEFRNDIICKICSKLENNTLIVVEHIKHGELLYDILSKNTNKKVFFIRGNVSVEDREKYKAIIELEDDHICIAISKIFSTGINIKNLHYIVFASAGKAKIKLIQSIGRGVRLHKNKNKLFIFDIADNLKYGAKHVSKRKDIYEEEGFSIKECEIAESKSKKRRKTKKGKKG